MPEDRLRDERCHLAGHRILRLLWDDLHPDEAELTVRRLRRMLAPA